MRRDVVVCRVCRVKPVWGADGRCQTCEQPPTDWGSTILVLVIVAILFGGTIYTAAC